MWHQPVRVEEIPLGYLLEIPFGIQMKLMDMHVCKKHYPKWVDRLVP